MTYLRILDALLVVCALVCLRSLYLWHSDRRKHLPPGPKGLPLIGNVLDMPDVEVWEAARKWGDMYGPVVHVRNFGSSYVFLNSYQAIVDLFEKRGHKYSSRPRNVMLDLEGWSEWFISIFPYGDELRRSRQLLHRFLQVAAVDDYTELQVRSAHKMLQGLVRWPDKYPELLRHSTGEMILMITYGYQVLEKDDPFVMLAEKGLEAVTEAEEFFLVNAFPSLQYLPSWFPGTSFKRIAERGYALSMAMYHEPYKKAKALLSDGKAAPSMTSKLLESKAAGDAVINDESLIAKATGIVYAAGADTTVSALHSFLLAMLLYPEVQRRAQDELDRVVGKDVLPTFNDRPGLPYIEALVKEVFRWQAVAPLAVAHTVDEDDEYNGSFIPAGSAVFPNIWAILRDSKEYEKPGEYIPERWLPVDGKELPLDVYKVVFGSGRRLCPGRHLAQNSVWIGAASLLTAFKITKALDEHGKPITPRSDDYTTHFVRHPKPFKYVLTPRSNKIKSVIGQAVESAS